MEKVVIYGENITQNEPPISTYNDNDCLIGFRDSKYANLRFGISEEQLSKHFLLLGGIGCGKTNVFNFMIKNVLDNMKSGDKVFIFDTKGDFYREFYDKNNANHIVIGNSKEYRDTTKYWNIFDELIDGIFKRENGKTVLNPAGLALTESNCMEMAKELFKGRESANQPFFSMAAADLTAKALGKFIRDEIELQTKTKSASVDDFSWILADEPASKNSKQDSVEGIEERLNNKKFVEWLKTADIKKYDEMIRSIPEYQNALSYIGDPNKGANAQALGVLAYISSMVNELFTGVFAGYEKGREFSMSNLVHSKESKVVFVEYDIKKGEVLGPIYRILFDIAFKEALGRRKHNNNVYFFIDEFKLLPDSQHIDDCLNFGRSLGVKVIAGIQSVNQVYSSYEERRGKAILAGFMNSICFATWDFETRKYISERFGENYSNITIRANNDEQTSRIQLKGFNVEDWMLLELKTGEAFVNLNGKKPFKFHFEKFD